MSVDPSTEASRKELYEYQKEDLAKVFHRLENCSANYNLLYQLPTGGGKTVVFSEITRRYIQEYNKRVLILTHRIELCQQTSRMLEGFDVSTMIIDSKVKELPKDHKFDCFVAMVETLNNRLNDKDISFDKIGLVIVDEAHYNSFRKLFKFFDKCFMLGVTATPLSSNINLPMNEIYNELIVGYPIKKLVAQGYLSKATTYSYQVGLGSLKVGINGDYTVKSSEILYSNDLMQQKLLIAYEERAKNRKTLIFNNGINTSIQVYYTFKEAGYPVRHIDSKISKADRKSILKWFKETPGAILSSVGILTTGFDEPTIQSIIINRATKSPTLYYQMIGRGSRVLPNKSTFDVIDLGNNAARFGLWEEELDWQMVFRSPNFYLESLLTDEEIERQFVYKMPEDLLEKFSKSKDMDFDVYEKYDEIKSKGLRTSTIIDESIAQHAKMITENADDLMEGFALVRALTPDIMDRIRRYCYCISNSTRNYKEWVLDDYNTRLRKAVTNHF